MRERDYLKNSNIQCKIDKDEEVHAWNEDTQAWTR